MKKIKVLVVDDNIYVRKVLIDLLSCDDGVMVVGEASDGLEAVTKTKELKPDIVTMDIDMPVMDGIEAIERIMASNAVPILVLTSVGDSRTAYEAISKGALEVILKPDFQLASPGDFIDKIKLLSRVKVISHISGRHVGRLKQEKFREAKKDRCYEVVGIASSTGGPKALSSLLSGLPQDFPMPVVIAQHIAEDFVTGMANWLDEISKLKVKPGIAGEKIAPGVVYISPADRHMVIDGGGRVAFKESMPRDIYFPSCDALLSSLASKYKDSAIGVILTGMGDDGVLGMKRIKEAGGATIAQNESSSVVFGMPKQAIQSGCIDKILPLNDICNGIINLIKSG